MVGLLGLANRTEGFTGQEPDYLRPFLHQVGLSLQIFSYFSLAERTIASSADREAVLSQQNNWYGHREVWSSLAHALNGIFATVSLQTQMLRTGVDSPDSVARGLDRMEAALASVSHYSDQLSLLGRMQSERVSRSSVDEILRTVEFLLGDSVETANRLIVINSLPDGSSVDLLPRELLSLLYAVAINAIEATEGSSEQIVIEATRDHTEAVIAVSDHGPGIPASVAALVSHRRVSSKSPSRGTGLLAVRTLAERIGGRLEIDSGPRGTTVVVRLPLLAQQ
jgi:two-component system C4-dicarboxylate transport sensor histidine kinase DctB